MVLFDENDNILQGIGKEIVFACIIMSVTI